MSTGNNGNVTIQDTIYPRRVSSDRWDIFSSKLPNGVRYLIQRNHNRNTVVVQCHWAFTYQRMIDAEIAHVLEHLLLRRRREKSEHALKRSIDSLGDFSAWVIDERIGIGADVPLEYSHRALPLMKQLVFLGDISQEQLDNEVRIIRTELRQGPSLVDDYALRLMLRRCLPRCPASSLAGGFIQNYAKISLEDLREFSERNFVPENLILGISGNVSINKVGEQVEKNFKNLKSTHREIHALSRKFRRGMLVSSRRSAELCGVALAHPVAAEKISQEALSIFLTLVGSLWSSRLFNAARREGAYGCSVWHDHRADNNLLVVNFSASPESVKAILRGYITQLNRLRTKGPTDSEINLAKKYIRSQAIIRASNIRERTMDLCTELLNRDSFTPFSKWIRQVNKLDHIVLRQSIREMLVHNGAHMVIYGNTRRFRTDKVLDSFIWNNSH